MQKKLLFEPFFGILRIFRSVQPKSECIFPFPYNLIIQLNTGDNHMLSPVVIKNGVCPHSGCSSTLVPLEWAPLSQTGCASIHQIARHVA